MEFICSECGMRVSAATRLPRCSCGGLWDLDFTPPVFDSELIDRDEWSIFRYRRFLALEDDSWRNVTLGEGMTPILRLNRDVMLKMDYYMPTSSFKDRGAAVLISHCKSIGITSVVQDSTGNAGNSVAAYCSRVDIACEIFVPEDTPQKMIDQIQTHGATCTVVHCNRDQCADLCRAKAREEDVYYASHVYNPLFFEGTKTYIYEVLEQLHRIPDNLLLPVANGALLIGVVRALEGLLASGVIAKMPQIIAVQSERCAPLFLAAQRGEYVPAEVTPGQTLAPALAIGKPKRGKEILMYAAKYGIRFVMAPEEEIEHAHAELASHGIYCELSTAANYAAYKRYCAQYGRTEDCLIALCGAGESASC